MKTIIRELIIDASTAAGQGALQFAYEHSIPYSGYVSQQSIMQNPMLGTLPRLKKLPTLRPGGQASLAIKKADAVLAIGPNNYKTLADERAIAKDYHKAFLWQADNNSQAVFSWLDTLDGDSITLFVSGPSALEYPDAFNASYEMLEILLTTA